MQYLTRKEVVVIVVLQKWILAKCERSLSMIEQMCIRRDYVNVYNRESLGSFVKKVTKKANEIKGKILNIEYVRDENKDCSGIVDTAIIVYKTK